MQVRGGARAFVDARTVVVERPHGLRGSADAGLFAALEPPLFLVDGGNLLWRAAHGTRAPFGAADGRDLTPLFRFFSLLRRACGTYGVFSECIVCFDGADAWSGRLAIDASYKSNRRYDTMDVTFMGWLPEIRAALDAAGIASIELEDREADDVIATLATRAGRRTVRILSTDRDYFQLVGPTLGVVNPKCRPASVAAAEIVERYGVAPHQWCDFRALAGDPSDGIPGVPGIGPKRAAELLDGGLTLDDLPRSGRLDPHVRDRWDDVLRWRELVRLRTDVPLPVEPTAEPSPRVPGPVAVCRELGLIV